MTLLDAAGLLLLFALWAVVQTWLRPRLFGAACALCLRDHVGGRVDSSRPPR